MGGTHSRHRSM